MDPIETELSRDLVIVNELGLHARSAAKIAALAGQSNASVWIKKGSEKADASSIVDILTLACEKGPQGIQYNVSEGERKELYAGAAGKVLLAFAPSEVRSAILNVKTFRRFTPHSIVDPKELVEELTIVRRQGYSFSEAERIVDAFAIAIPVFDHRQNCCSALGIAGPINRFPPDVRTRSLKIVQEFARTLSERLGAVTKKTNDRG